MCIETQASCHKHLSNITEQSEQRICILKYHGFNFDAKSLRQIYLAYIRPIVEYCSPVWCNINSQEVDNLEKTNLTALRIM